LNLVHLRLNNFSFFVFDRFAFGSFQAQFSEVSLSTWKLEERILLKLLPVSFLQQNGFILRQVLFVLHLKLLNEGLFGEELCIFEIFPELLTKITL
jgi:hypothetical protein